MVHAALTAPAGQGDQADAARCKSAVRGLADELLVYKKGERAVVASRADVIVIGDLKPAGIQRSARQRVGLVSARSESVLVDLITAIQTHFKRVPTRAIFHATGHAEPRIVRSRNLFHIDFHADIGESFIVCPN